MARARVATRGLHGSDKVAETKSLMLLSDGANSLGRIKYD